MIKKVKYPIALKLVIVISILSVVALGAIMFVGAYFLRMDVQLTAEQSNHTTNNHVATIADYEIKALRDNAEVFMASLYTLGLEDESVPYYTSLFFDSNQEMAVMAIPGMIELVNDDFFAENGVSVRDYYAFVENSAGLIEKAKKGEVIIANATATFGLPTMALMLPWTRSEDPSILLAIISVESLVDSFGSDSISASYMLNDANDILIHPDFDLMYSAANMTNTTLVEEMRTNNDRNRQIVFTDSDGIEFFGAYTKLDIGDIGVFTVIERSVIFESVDRILYQNTLLGLAVIFIVILFVRFFAKSIAKPLVVLAEASEQIEYGNFSLDLTPKTRDEVGLLTSRFVSMSQGLEVFGRFVNLDVALKAMKGELKLGGESKDVSILFSDIRAFTEMSEKMDPSEVINFLNDYMTRMVNCVTETGGAVDKYIGDAIMGVWGASSSTGSSQRDALNTVRAALMMRNALQEFNVGRGSNEKPIISIGCGINSGTVVAGQMGSLTHMEYTVLGDAVNLASRTEMLTKLFFTDILITESTYELIKEHVVVEKMPPVSVKGKAEPVVVYALINMVKEESLLGLGKNGPKTLQELRSLLGLPTPDFENVNLDAEERKYHFEG